MPSLNIVGRFNSAGVENDMKILGRLLKELGHQVTYSEAGKRPLYFIMHKKACFDANIFIESPEPLYFPAAPKNFLKPNQEVPCKLNGIDCVFAKTRYAEDLFQKKGVKTRYMGFTSLDRLRPGIAKEPFFLHVTSRSTLKGTPEVIETWRRYPDMPPLVILVAPLFRHLMVPLPHVTWIDTFLPEEELITLQNRAQYHLCPSYTEGFGHSLGEALSTGAIVVTTDAPPMNELITEERGVLCSWTNAIPAGLGQGFYCTPEQIRSAVFRALALPDKDLVSQKARQFFETLSASLKERLSSLILEEITP